MRHLPFLNASFSRYLANLAIKTPRRTESVSSAVSDSGKSDYFSEEKEFLAGSSLGRPDVKSASRKKQIPLITPSRKSDERSKR